MKQRLSNWISSNWLIFFLVVFEIFLAWKNILPETWLTGWDSTQPELNFKLNLARSLSPIWQEYRGVGLPDGMAHAANIVHLFYVWLLSLALPDNLIRYVFVFLTHLVGGIGMYKLLQYFFKKSNWLALAGATFYLLNPITIQMFYQPLELFVIYFAGLPWLVITLIKYLETGGKWNLIQLFLVLLLFVSQNHVPTIFIVTMTTVGIVMMTALLVKGGKNWRRPFAALSVILGVNSFWLLPYIVTTVSNSKVIPQSKVNILSNPEVILRNSEYGDLSSLVRMQGFSLSFEDWHIDGSMGLQMLQWNTWWDMTSVQIMMWSVFGLAIMGMAKSVWKRDWRMMAVGLIWSLALFNLGVRIPGIEQVMSWIYTNVPLYSAVFRFAFTKFAITFAFASTILAMYSLEGIVRGWGKIVAGIIVIGSAIWITWPAFNGEFLYKELRVNLPNEYGRLFDYINEVETERIARLPINDLWGWESNNWGYRGSGIVWQGVKSPMMLRSFDPWSPYNETFYNQLSTALYEGNKNDVVRVLGQYDIKYVLLDESVIAPGQDNKILRREETKQIARDLGWQERFQEGFVTVWEVPGDYGQQFVSAPEQFTFAEGETTKVRKDVIWKENGTYVSGKGGVIYPFADLMKEEVNGVSYDGDSVTIERKIDSQEGQRLIVPGLKGGQKIHLAYTAKLDNDKLRIVWQPLYTVNGQTGPKLADQEFPVGGGNGVWVKMNESRPLWVEIDKEIKGDAELTTDEAIKLSVYNGEGRQQVVSDLWLERNIQENCGEGIVCISIPLAKPKNDSLAQVVQKYSGTRPGVCVDREGGPYKCEDINTKMADPIITMIPTKIGELNYLDISLSGSKADLLANLETPLVINFPLLKSEEIAANWEEFTEAKEFDLQGQALKVEVEMVTTTYDLATLGSQEITNCDVLKRGSVTKENNKYTANERGAGCDYVEMKNLDIRVPYLMRMRGEDVTGRSLKFFLHNTGNGRNDIEYLLDKGSFDQNFAVLPWGFPGHYTLNVETRSFGQETINMLEPVEVRYFPLEQVASARIVQGASVIKYSSNLEIEKVIKKGTWLYWIDLDGTGLLRLSQGYDNGWLGIGLMDDGGFDLSHVKVDGWANGWIVPQDVNRVVIFYWPQLLEYLGFALLGVTILVIVRLQK